MGAAASSPFVATESFFRIKEHVSESAATIDICLACEKDSYAQETRNIGEMKEHFREFMRDVLPTDKYTVFRWSTWDTDNADIVIPTEDLVVARRQNVDARYRMPSRRVFDAIFTLHCPFACVSDKSLRTACALLKSLGLLVVVSSDAASVHEAFRVRPTPLGDCSDDSSYRLHQVFRSAQGRFQMIVWQKWPI